jgi:hypothetical protein
MNAQRSNMSQHLTTAVASLFALANIGLCWIGDDSLRFMLRCMVSVSMIPASVVIWRCIVIYTAKQLAKAEPIIAAALAHRD